MALTTASEGRLPIATDRLVDLAVPVGLAVVTWLTLLLAVGVLVRVNAPSIIDLVPLFFVVVLLWPVYLAAPWREGVSARVRRWAREQPPEFAVVVGLGLLPLVPFVPDPLVSLLQLPYRGSGVFFGASLFYRQRFGPTVGRLLLVFAQTYFKLIWLFLLSKGVLGLVRRLR